VAATLAAVRTTPVTASADGCGRAAPPDSFVRVPVAVRCAGAPAPAAVLPGFGVAAGFARARGFEARGAFAAGFPPASAFAAALLAALDGLPPGSLFSLLFPGRE
jgi:hypothetical protein